jgi:2'-hydroxyisoflavone reductase
VYPDWPQDGVSEDSRIYGCSADATGTAEDEANWSAAQYGSYKAGCERAVAAAFDGKVLILRPGVILGPGENVGRLTWWLTRIAAGGRVLAPGESGREIQPVDIRDLAAFALACMETGIAGIFNVTAPLGHETFGGLLGACVDATGSDAVLEWVGDDFLVAHGVRQWTEIPLWRTQPGTWRVDPGRAIAHGLRCRPVKVTVTDTWRWLSSGQGPSAYDRQAHHGLDRDKERHLLELWGQRSHPGSGH